MRILAVDTATGPCSVAVWDHGHITAYVENTRPVQQSASLMPMVEDALKQANLAYGDLHRVACTTGPGSFTGIRVGLAAARGICFAAGIKGAGYTTLGVLAHAVRETKTKRILAILNAGKGEWYYQWFVHSKATGEPALGTLGHIIPQAGEETVTIAGNAIIEDTRFIASPITFPRADALAALAAGGTQAGEMHPFYIREPDAKLPLKTL